MCRKRRHDTDLTGMLMITDIAFIMVFFNYLANNNSCDIILQEGETMNYRFLDYHEFEELVKSDRFVRSEQGRFIKFQKDIERIIDRYMKKKQK